LNIHVQVERQEALKANIRGVYYAARMAQAEDREYVCATSLNRNGSSTSYYLRGSSHGSPQLDCGPCFWQTQIRSPMLLPFEGSIGMNNDTTSRRYTSRRCQLSSLFVLAFEGKESDALSSIAVRSLSSLAGELRGGDWPGRVE